jgi:hypothetical protein
VASAVPTLRPNEFAGPIRAIDVVRTGDNAHPLYRVIAVYGDRAWLRDIQHGTDHVVPVARLRKDLTFRDVAAFQPELLSPAARLVGRRQPITRL